MLESILKHGIAGVLGPVTLDGLNEGRRDLSCQKWTYQIGLKGEALSLNTLSGSSSVEWQDASEKQPLMWYKVKTKFDPEVDDGKEKVTVFFGTQTGTAEGFAKQAKLSEFEGYSGKPLYSTWFGSESEERAVFVDEVKCIGCLKCALFANKTFAIESVYGRARVVSQWAVPEDKILEAIETCPVDKSDDGSTDRQAILTNPYLLKVYLRLVVLVEVLTDAVMATNLLLPEVFLPLVVV